ncbi:MULTISPECIES: hypothetical protein, partial [unclassified Lentimicrobium]|uniref:hypothetical protein n=1 Tax=unclassified Lentimicrobium TaxID=2677434 RepID=UPI0015545837
LEVAGKTKTESLQITNGVCNTNYILTASDANGNAIWKDINDFMGESIWSENSSGNVYFEDGHVGIGTNNPQSPLDIDFGSQTIGLGFVGNTYSSSNTYSDFKMETSYESGKPELTFKTANGSARYNWACQGVDKMTLEMVYYGDPSATRLILHDGTIITERLKVTSATDVSGYVLTADADGDATWQEPQFKDINGNLFFNGRIGIGTENAGTHKLAVNGS